jgi:hypothetical protein
LRLQVQVNYKAYSDEEFILAVKESKSLAGVMKKIGIKPVGGNYHTVKKKILEFGLDTSHFSGKASIPKGTELKKFDELVSTDAIKKRLVKERGHQCECCQKTMWLGGSIVLELDHVNGDRFNNTRENLRLLCPNCHALTPTYRGKNISKESKGSMSIRMKQRGCKNTEENIPFLFCQDCNCQVKTKSKTGRCLPCHAKASRKTARPPLEILMSEIANSSFIAVGRKYGVSDNAIRKWLRAEGCDPRTIKSVQYQFKSGQGH